MAGAESSRLPPEAANLDKPYPMKESLPVLFRVVRKHLRGGYVSMPREGLVPRRAVRDIAYVSGVVEAVFGEVR